MHYAVRLCSFICRNTKLLTQKHKTNGFSYSKSYLIFIVKNYFILCFVKQQQQKNVLSRCLALKKKKFLFNRNSELSRSFNMFSKTTIMYFNKSIDFFFLLP